MEKKTGVLIIGALGHLASTVILGSIALKKGICQTTGMVTELDDFAGLELIKIKNFVFGGWDIRQESFFENVKNLVEEINFRGITDLSEIEDEIHAISANIFAGTSLNCGKAIEDLNQQKTDNNNSVHDIVCRLKNDITQFKKRKHLDLAVVINLSSTEPSLPFNEKHRNWESLNEIIDKNDRDSIIASTIYAYAAINSNCPYINFTPSTGAMIPALIGLAEKCGVPVMGNDGKTGETLVKSALAPMFASRNMNVLSWEGFNILGNMDGKVLSHRDNKLAKVKSKDRVLSKILGYKPHSKVSIEYVPSLGDWKTAWDFIHFEGFLNTKMSLQFTWQGCDSALAAPLALDLVRFAAFAYKKGEKGLMKHLAFFFKSPVDVDEHNLHEQFQMLQSYAQKSK